jgi:hypothetical protein
MIIRISQGANRLVWYSYTALNMVWFWPLLIVDHLIDHFHKLQLKYQGEQWIRRTRRQITGMD